MSKAAWAFGGVGLGAGLMYWADPRSGGTRRAHARERAFHAIHGVRCALKVVGRDMAHRARGLFYRVSSRFHPEDVDDVTLEARVRSALGRVCSHPGAIRVACRHGEVELKGAILASERKPVLACVRHVRGVREIDDDLEAQEQAGGHPELQGGEGGRGRGRSCCNGTGHRRRASWWGSGAWG